MAEYLYINDEICNQRLSYPRSLFCDTRTNIALASHSRLTDSFTYFIVELTTNVLTDISRKSLRVFTSSIIK